MSWTWRNATPDPSRPDWQLAVGPPLLGWRAWRVSEDGEDVVLRSMFKYETVWPGRAPLVGKCLCQPHPSPHEAPGIGAGEPCGIYAVKDRETTRAWQSYVSSSPREARHFGVVIGRVQLWGRIVRHEHGYRAQFAYPGDLVVVELEPGVDGERVGETLRERYAVPLVVEARGRARAAAPSPPRGA
jgi:hypothetical protein